MAGGTLGHSAHEGLKAAIRRVMGASWQRCSAHWMRNALAHFGKAQQSMVSAALRQAFTQPDRVSASWTLNHTAEQPRAKWPKLAAFIDDSKVDVPAHIKFPVQHKAKNHYTDPIERLNKEVKRLVGVDGIFPNEAAIFRLVDAVLLEQNDEWQTQSLCTQTEPMPELAPPADEVFPPQSATVAA